MCACYQRVEWPVMTITPTQSPGQIAAELLDAQLQGQAEPQAQQVAAHASVEDTVATLPAVDEGETLLLSAGSQLNASTVIPESVSGYPETSTQVTADVDYIFAG